jgi:hypothetical protein
MYISCALSRWSRLLFFKTFVTTQTVVSLPLALLVLCWAGAAAAAAAGQSTTVSVARLADRDDDEVMPF